MGVVYTIQQCLLKKSKLTEISREQQRTCINSGSLNSSVCHPFTRRSEGQNLFSISWATQEKIPESVTSPVLLLRYGKLNSLVKISNC